MRPITVPARTATLLLTLALSACGSPASGASSTLSASDLDLDELSRAAVSDDAARAEASIAALRARGRAGFDALRTTHAAHIARLRDTQPRTPSAADARLRHALDRVSMQRDAHASGLYWHTDFEAALAESHATGKPILSLRLLGKLDEERSCANSRYFRTVLYANETVSAALAAGYVLHWSTERPAPRMTIDFGDGRTLERTFTGNSIHYLIDSDGRVIDALPGLSTPSDFLAELGAARGAFTRCGGLATDAADACYASVHRQAREQTAAAWTALRTQIPSLPALESFGGAPMPREAAQVPNAISARLAMMQTVGKMIVEMPALNAVQPVAAPAPTVAPESVDWSALVAPGAGDSVLDARSRALIMLKSRGRGEAIGPALARAATMDAMRNRFAMHDRLRGWLLADGPRPRLTDFNTRVYTELFLTPASDPWLGLRAPDVWDAIEDVSR